MNAIFGEFQKLANLELVMNQRITSDTSSSNVDTSHYGDGEEEDSAKDVEKEALPADVVQRFWKGVDESISKHFQVQPPFIA